jgi:ABC-type transport system involved in multi-copper enzyme maturation permease subunit
MRLVSSLHWSNSRQAWAERLAAGLLLIWAAALLACGGRIPTAYGVVLWGLFGLALAVLLRRGWIQLFGPVLFYDLVRVGRQSRHAAARTFYGGILLTLFLFVYLAWLADNGLSFHDAFFGGALPSKALAGYAQTFCFVFLGVQMLAVFLLTPAYLAGAIAEEKERRTLEGLLASDLRDREILFGLLFARLGNLVLVLLTGLPALSLLQFMGGVDPNLILAGFAFAGLTVAGLAGLSVFNSLQARKPRQAIVRTYLMAAGYLVVSGASWLLLLPRLGLASFPSTDKWASPVTLSDVVLLLNAGNPIAAAVRCVDEVRTGQSLDVVLPALLRSYAWFHGLLAVGCCVWASWWLRARILQEGESSTRKDRGQRRLATGHKGLGLLEPPGVSEGRPMLWKELFIDAGVHRGPFGMLLTGVLAALALWPAVHLVYWFGSPWPEGMDSRFTDLMNLWVRGLSMVLGVLMLLQVAVHAAGSISGERERQTLDGLLATPLSNRTILLAKWLGSMSSPRATAACLGLVWLVGWATGGLSLLAIPCFLGAWLAMAACMAGLGLCLSSVYGSSYRAAFWTLLAVFGLLVATMLASWDLSDLWLPSFEAESIMPFLTLAFLAFSPREFQAWRGGEMSVSFQPIFWAAVGWLLLGYMFWRLACWRFGREFGRRQVDEGEEAEAVSSVGAGAVKALVDDGAPGAPPRVRLWPRRLVYAFLLLLPTGMLAARYVQLHRAADRDLQEAEAEADRLDPGWRWEELEAARKTMPDDQNAGLLAVAVDKQVSVPWPNQEEEHKLLEGVLPPERLLNDEQIKCLRSQLAHMRDALVQARRLADFPEGRLPLRWSKDGTYVLLEHTHKMGTVARLLGNDVLCLAQDNDPDGALRSCRAMINTNRAIGDEPSLISVQVRIGLRVQAVGKIERVLGQGEPSEPALAALQRLLEDEERQPLAVIGLRGQRAEWDRMLRNLQEGKASYGMLIGGLPRSQGMAHLPNQDELASLSSGPMASQRADLIRYGTELVEAAKLPESQSQVLLNTLQKSLTHRQHMVSLLGAWVGRFMQIAQRGQAQLRCTIVALAAERFRRQHGRWPDTLTELTPEYLEMVPVDPFDGLPLRWSRKKGHVVVYSIGPDGVDNGGVIDRERPLRNGIDVGVVLWDPDQRRQPPLPPKTE